MFNAFTAQTNLKCSLSKYKKFFYRNFNLGFGNPHSDTCFICKEFSVNIKKIKILEKKNELRTKYRLHKMRAKAFFQYLNKHKENTIKICFDCQQNQPLPKLSVGEVFYSRQVWLYNLGIVRHQPEKQRREDVQFYVWLESQAGRGCNEISSGLSHYLLQLEKKLVDEGRHDLNLELFSDSCIAQNKNSILMTVLANFLEKSVVFKEIKHFFPIRGHSFMPADRVFGRVEKDYRRREEIIVPTEYYNILNKHGNVNILGQDWKIFDFKMNSQKILRKKFPFKITEARVLTYQKTKNRVICKIRTTYSGSDVQVNIFKNNVKNTNVITSSPELPLINHVSALKKSDVKKLLGAIDLTDAAKKFYDQIINDVPNTTTTEAEDEEHEVLLCQDIEVDV